MGIRLFCPTGFCDVEGLLRALSSSRLDPSARGLGAGLWRVRLNLHQGESRRAAGSVLQVHEGRYETTVGFPGVRFGAGDGFGLLSELVDLRDCTRFFPRFKDLFSKTKFFSTDTKSFDIKLGSQI